MPKLIEIKDSAKLVLVGGAICTGKDVVASKVAEILKQNNYSCSLLSLEECLKAVGKLDEESPREKYWAMFNGKENEPLLSMAISRVYEAEPGQIIIVSGIKRKCDAEYFHKTFPNSYFISLIADDQTLAERIAARNSPMDFPAGTDDAQKQDIAKKLLAGEEKAYGTMQALGYAATQVQRQNSYLIENGKDLSKHELELLVYKALIHFKIV